MLLRLLTAAVFLLICPFAYADVKLAERIDALVGAKGKGKALSPSAEDATFLRRAYLDFAGRIPSGAETRKFLENKAPDKRVKLLDMLLASGDYPVRMQEIFDVILMERLGEHADWTKYLRTSFEKNKPWDQMARELLSGSRPGDAAGAVFFLSKRLESFGANPVDYPALTRDIGRLFLGQDFRCAQCHDHLTVNDYRQRDFQGLYAFVKNISLAPGKAPGVIEKLTAEKVEFASVFGGDKAKTGPRVPGREEVAIPVIKKGEEYIEKPDPKTKTPGVLKFSTLRNLGDQVTAAEQAFSRNMVNRLWFILMGRGLVHPLDLHHGDNPAAHPEVLDLLAKEFVASKYDMKAMLRTLALTATYQRSSQLPPGEKEAEASELRTAQERRLEAETLLRAMLEATGEKQVKGGATFDSARPLFLKAFAFPPREPEEEFSPTLKAALFVLNDKSVLKWLTPKPGNLLDRLQKLDNDKVAEELYLSVLTRLPSEEERGHVARFLGERKERREAALRNLAWALLASTEFCVNH